MAEDKTRSAAAASMKSTTAGREDSFLLIIFIYIFTFSLPHKKHRPEMNSMILPRPPKNGISACSKL